MVGRPKGLKNKATLEQEAAREASPVQILHMVFHRMGGLDGFQKWAEKNPDKFYEMFRKTAPSSKPGQAHKGGAPRNQSIEQPPVVEVRDFSK